MFDIDQTTLKRVIELASSIQMEREADLVEEINRAEDDWVESGADNTIESDLYNEFVTLIDNLSREQQQQSVAALWLGRGDYAIDEWQHALVDAKREWSRSNADYLLSHAQLAEDLCEATMMISSEEVAVSS